MNLMGFLLFTIMFFWQDIRDNFTRIISDFADGLTDIAKLNCVIIVLIPKISGAHLVSQFRPVGLLNVSFKINMKVLLIDSD